MAGAAPGVAAVAVPGFGNARATEKSPAAAMPNYFTLATQFARVGNNCAV